MKIGERFPCGTSRRFFRYRSSGGFLFFWTMMVEKIVIGNKSATSWECEPHKTKMGVRFFYFPKMGGGCKRKGVRCFAYRDGAVFACFLCFWKPQKLYVKPNVLLNTLHILNQVPWLTFQEGADCVQSFPGHQFPPPELLKVRLAYQLFFTDAGGRIPLLLQFCQNIHLVSDCHKIRLLFHHPYSIIELH